MKRAMPWSDQEEDSSSSDELSTSDTDAEADGKPCKSGASSSAKAKTSQDKLGKKQGVRIDFEALKQHGYKGGLSVLNVPPPKADEKQDWSWSTGKERGASKEIEESYEDRQKTRAALADGEQLTHVLTRKDKKNVSFSQKEKRKRELGQASRGKNYVEEEKRLLRDSGVYSGFDS